MPQLMHALSTVRPILEAIYFASSVVIAVIAIKGLHQLKLSREQLELTRKLASESNKREAFKLAAEQCRYFGERIVQLGEATREDCSAKNISIFSNVRFKVRDGEIVEHNFAASNKLYAEFSKITGTLVPLLNSLEAFSLFFESELAD